DGENGGSGNRSCRAWVKRWRYRHRVRDQSATRLPADRVRESQLIQAADQIKLPSSRMRPTEQTGRPPDRAAGAVATIDKYQHGSCRAAARARRGRRPGHAVDTSIWTLPKRAACTRTGTSAGTHGVGGGSALTKST